MTVLLVGINEFRATDKFVEYKIEVRLEGDETEVWHRFSDFEHLLKELKSDGYSTTGARMPSKVRNTAPAKRMERLQRVLEVIIRENTLGRNHVGTAPRRLLNFLGVTAAVDAIRNSEIQEYIPHEQVPEEFREPIETVMQQLTELDNCISSGGLTANGWKNLGTSGTFSWFLNYDTSTRLAAGFCPQSTGRMIHEMFYDSVAMKLLEPNIDSISTIKKLGPQTSVQHIVMKSIMWLPPRDIITVRHWRVLPESGSIVHAEWTIEDFPGVPAKDTEGRVRAVQKLGGCVIHQDPKEPTRSFVFRVSDLDPRVKNIPAGFENKINEATASMLSANLINLAKLCKTRDLKLYVSAGNLRNVDGEEEDILQPMQTAKLEPDSFQLKYFAAIGVVLIAICILQIVKMN